MTAPGPNTYPKMPSQLITIDDEIAGVLQRLVPLRYIKTRVLVVFPTPQAEAAFVPATAEPIVHHTLQDSSHTQSDWAFYGGLLQLPWNFGDNWRKASQRVRRFFMGEKE
jgi:hypothetical protein